MPRFPQQELVRRGRPPPRDNQTVSRRRVLAPIVAEQRVRVSGSGRNLLPRREEAACFVHVERGRSPGLGRRGRVPTARDDEERRTGSPGAVFVVALGRRVRRQRRFQRFKFRFNLRQ